jgi:hypothetical protein
VIRGPFEELVGGFEHVGGSFGPWLALRGYLMTEQTLTKTRAASHTDFPTRGWAPILCPTYERMEPITGYIHIVNAPGHFPFYR